MPNLNDITDYIVLLAAICVAIQNIYKFFKRPVEVVKDKVDEQHQKELEELSNKITKSVLEKTEPLMNEIKHINIEQNEKIEQLRKGQLDLLRQQILYLYEHHCENQTLTSNEKEQLHKLYIDYSEEGGNSFVAELYNQMSQWKIVP